MGSVTCLAVGLAMASLPVQLLASREAYTVTKLDPLVVTNSGKIRGFRQEKFGRYVNTFLGIPFAEPPIGVLRFRRPRPVKAWQRELKAMFLPPSCAQPDVVVNKVFNFSGEERSEDCLYLNVWAPADVAKSGEGSLKAVMVFLYGGAFFFGSTNYRFYDGATLASVTDVVVVTVNYRLGPFGFLNARIAEIPGNQGLWDQLMAFRWVNENIGHFGGDRDLVTVFGHSAGGISLGFHLVSPRSRGLFKRAIIMSGAPYYKITDDPEEARAQFEHAAAKLGCARRADFETSAAGGADMKAVVRCLLAKNTSEVLDALDYFNDRVKTSYVPWPGDDLLPQDLPDAIRDGNVNDVDLLVGATSDEGSLFIEYYLSSVLDFERPQSITPRALRVYLSMLFRLIRQPEPEAIAQRYVASRAAAGYGADEPGRWTGDYLRQAGHSLGDFGFVCPLVAFAGDMAARNASSSVHFYEFAYRPSYSWNAPWHGVAHFDEIPFVFGTNLDAADGGELRLTRDERIFTLFVMHTWTNFAKTGRVPRIYGEEWPRFDGRERAYVRLDGRNTEIRKGAGSRCDFWASRMYKFSTTARPDLAALWNRTSPADEAFAAAP